MAAIQRLACKAALTLAVVMVLYVSVYGLVRWRKILVRYEYFSERKEGPLISEIGAGRDPRTSLPGALKNAAAPPVEVLYTPLRAFEAACWNGGHVGDTRATQ